MALVRRLARPMLGAVFIASGIDALRSPGPRVEMASDVGPRLARALGLPEDPETLVRINAGVQVGAGLMLASGKFPRLAAVALFASLVPTTVAGHSYWAAETPEERAHHRTHFLKNVGLGGGLLLAAVDTGGKPSLGWWTRHAAKKARRSAAEARESAYDVVEEVTDRVEEFARTLTDRLPQTLTDRLPG